MAAPSTRERSREVEELEAQVAELMQEVDRQVGNSEALGRHRHGRGREAASRTPRDTVNRRTNETIWRCAGDLVSSSTVVARGAPRLPTKIQ